MWRAWSLALVMIALGAGWRCMMAAESPAAEKYLHAGNLVEGEKALREALTKDPKDQQARFGLGTLQFIRAVEHLGQSLYRYGLRSDRGQRIISIPFLRLPIPVNPKPEVFTNPAAREILEDVVTDLEAAETTLAAIDDARVKLALHLGPILLDFAGDGKAGESESLITLVNRYLGAPRNDGVNGNLLIVFDRGDVAWLRGYCHLLMALAEIALAHDGSELFDCTAHIFFAKPQTPHTFLTKKSDEPVFYDIGDGVDVIDLIALIHLIRLPVQEPARLSDALGHLKAMFRLSKESWKFIVAETDDDHEWIPNPKQKGGLGIKVRQEMIDSWLEFADEMEAILSGERLIPFWRGAETRGINLRRVFLEPRPLDLVLWLQGTAATGYLEEGALTKPDVWGRLQRVFGGQFFGFAIWFN
jgi:hypothetical protein